MAVIPVPWRSFRSRALRSAYLNRFLHLFCVVLTSLALANCAGTQVSRSGNKYGVKPSPKVVADGEPVPKGGGRDMIGKPYMVGGETYVPHPGRGYAREGSASWYGAAFHGRLTANGEVFDKESIAAAHPTLPLPSYVRVTNVATRRSMIVRVNDRGPYERGRLLDVSERVADALEFHRKGTTRGRVEYVGRASLNGSDDRKLLATLRSESSPRRPVLLAGLDERTEATRKAATTIRDPLQSPTPDGTVLAKVEAEGSLPTDTDDLSTPLAPATVNGPTARQQRPPVLASAEPSADMAESGSEVDRWPPDRLAGIY